MHAFTVGSVAALINAVIAILQLALPNLLIIALVATLSETHSAVTWSVVARNLHSSNWPLLLRSDSAATQHVRLSTTVITLLRPVALGLVAIAAIVTPLGLYEDIQPGNEMTRVSFVAQKDDGPFGLLTPPRSNLGFSRSCSDGGALPAQCPGTTTMIEYSDDGNQFNATIVNDDYDRRIPAQLAELYQSGLSSQPASVSSFFDIQCRWYNAHKRDNIHNRTYIVETYYPIESVIGDRDFKLIEGLIIDTRDGGVGFRAHTVPLADEAQYGAEWDEEIMFLVPETACVDTNTTLETKVPEEDDFSLTLQQNLVDHGGFAGIDRHNPWEDGENGWYGDTQRDAKLLARAYRGGWTMNMLNMYVFNVTEPYTNFTAPIDSHVGKRFPVNNSLSTDVMSGTMSIATLSLDPYQGLVGVPETPMTSLNGSRLFNVSSTTTSLGQDVGWANPFDISEGNFSVADMGCVGWLSDDWVNATNIQVKCGIIMSPANKTGGLDSMLVEPGSTWTRSAYMCASATKATIKRVRFTFNHTAGSELERLTVKSMHEKKYDADEDLPTWGIETPNMTIGSMTPLWGLVDPDKADSVNLTTFRAGHMYVPASSAALWQNELTSIGGSGYMPGTASPAMIWQSAYSVSQSSVWMQDLSGKSSLALASTWKNMSASANGTASMMNLIWTDLAANALIGTRGWLSTPGSLPPNLQHPTLRKRDSSTTPTARGRAMVPVHVYQRVVRYRWVYGIPAALCLLLAGLIGLAALVALVSGQGAPSRIRFYLDRLSAGRLLLALVRNEHDFDSERKSWLAANGSKPLRLPASGYFAVPLQEQVVVAPK